MFPFAQSPVLWIQIILVIAIGIVAVMLTRSTTGARHQAIRRLLLGAFVASAVVAVLFPSMLSTLAQLVGVGRGTDLLLYALVIAFVSYITTSHRRSTQLNRQITLLTRELSLAEARAPQRATDWHGEGQVCDVPQGERPCTES